MRCLRRPSFAAFALLLVAASLCSLSAEDKVLPKQRKKFKLHAVGMGFKSSDMPSKRVIPNPTFQQPGVIVGDAVIYSAELSPSLTLADSRYTWTGVDSMAGASAVVGYSQVENRAVSVGVFDKRTNTNRTVAATTRARSVGTETESGICTTTDVQTLVFCARGAKDADLATTWSRSAATCTRLGLAAGCGSDNGNGKSNSAMHSYWNALMTRDTGAGFAERVATAHEKFSINFTGIDAGDPHNASVMDLDNNARGRAVAGGLTFETAAGTDDPGAQDAIVSAVNAGTMTKMDDVNNPGRGGLMEPSNK